MRKTANYKLCKKYVNRYVQIRTAQGVYEGKIIKVDQGRVYLQEGSQFKDHKVHISFFPVILPLVLFDLLVIVLLDRPCRPYYPCPPHSPF